MSSDYDLHPLFGGGLVPHSQSKVSRELAAIARVEAPIAVDSTAASARSDAAVGVAGAASARTTLRPASRYMRRKREVEATRLLHQPLGSSVLTRGAASQLRAHGIKPAQVGKAVAPRSRVGGQQQEQEQDEPTAKEREAFDAASAELALLMAVWKP